LKIATKPLQRET